MVKTNTGLSINSQSDPEVQPSNELNHPRADNDSDSDLEPEDEWGQYMPLSQNPADGNPLFTPFSDSDEEDLNQSQEVVNEPKINDASTSLVEQVWSSKPKSVDIEMNESKIDLVKSVMTNIQLPKSAVPEWANNIPENAWKEHLLKKIHK